MTELGGIGVPNKRVATALTAFARSPSDPSLAIVLLTGRPISVQPITYAWLERYQLRWDLLIMRDYGDYQAATQFKRRTVHELREHDISPQLAFEDDRRNVAMFHREGVPCVYIHSGYFE